MRSQVSLMAKNRSAFLGGPSRRRKCLLLCCSLLCGGSALAHEGEEIDEIVVEGRWDSLFGMAVSASEGIVGQAELDIRPRLRTGDMLEVVPGLIVTQHSGTGKSNQMFLRGFNLDHGTDFATWIEGMPINQPTHGHGQGYTDLNFIIPELVDTLEFRKGPYYADVSDFSSAGAAFFSVASELDSPIIKLGLGEHGFGRLLLADSFETGRGKLLVGGQAHRYDGPWVGVSEDFDAYTGLARYSEVGDTSEWSVMLMGYDASWNSADQVPRRAVVAGLVSPLGTIDDTVGGATSRYSLSGRWHRDFETGNTLTVRGYVINYELDLYSNFTYFLDDPDNGDQFQQVDDRMIWGGDITWSARLGSDTTQKLGLSLRVDDIDQVGLFRTTARERTGLVRQDGVLQSSTGLFYNVDHRFSDHWRGTLGVRADFFDFDVRDSNIASNAGTRDDAIISPKLNLIYTVSETTEAYISAGRGYHSNDARGAVISVDPATGDPVERVDPLVASTGAEIGFRYFDESRVSVSAALWYLELDSELLFVGDAGNTEASRTSSRYGIEVPVYVRISDTWLADLEVALTRSKFDDDDPAGNEIPGSLDRVIAAGLVGSFKNGLYTSLRGRHFGPRPLTEDGDVESDSSTVWNLAVGYRRDSFDFRIEALNLFDSRDDDITYFYNSRLPGEPAAGNDDIHFHPIEPRSIRAHLTWFPAR